jgi:hypothetical protein
MKKKDSKKYYNVCSQREGTHHHSFEQDPVKSEISYFPL